MNRTIVSVASGGKIDVEGERVGWVYSARALIRWTWRIDTKPTSVDIYNEPVVEAVPA